MITLPKACKANLSATESPDNSWYSNRPGFCIIFLSNDIEARKSFNNQASSSGCTTQCGSTLHCIELKERFEGTCSWVSHNPFPFLTKEHLRLYLTAWAAEWREGRCQCYGPAPEGRVDLSLNLNKSKTDFLSRNLKSFVKAVWEKSKWQWLSQQNSTLSSFLRSWLDYCTNTAAFPDQYWQCQADFCKKEIPNCTFCIYPEGGSDQTYHQKHR